MSNRQLVKLYTMGFLTHDVDEIYVGDEDLRSQERRYYVQLDGGINAKSYWTEPTTHSPQKYLRDDLKDYPDAMILKTKFL